VAEYKVKLVVDSTQVDKLKDEVKIGAGGGKTAEKLSGSTGKLFGIIGKLLPIAAVIASLMKVFEPILELVGGLLAYLGMVAISGLVDVLKGTWENLKSTADAIMALPGFILDLAVDLATKITEWLMKAGEAIYGAILGIWDNFIKPAWEFLKNVGLWIWEQIIKPAWNFLLNVGSWVWEQIIKPGFDFLADIGSKIWDWMKSVWVMELQLGSLIWENIKSVWTWSLNLGSKIWEHIKSVWTWSVDIGAKLWAWIKSKLTGGIAGSKAFGGTVAEDGLYRLHAGESVSRGNTTNVSNSPTINISVAGRGNTDIADEISRKVTMTLNQFQRW
jgi:hypothetical protein